MRIRLTGAVLLTGEGPERGPIGSWDQLGLQRGWDVVIESAPKGELFPWRIAWLGPASGAPPAEHTVDLQGQLVLPGLVDAHTHLVFAGDRSGEFVRRMAGTSYAQIASEGGGILHTVRQTRAATQESLVQSADARLRELAAQGVRVVEVKTGYGLDLESEVRILQSIRVLREAWVGRVHVVATAMPAHAVPPEHKATPDRYVDQVVRQILPALAQADPQLAFVDVFVEQGYFSVAQAQRVDEARRRLGLQLKAHVDEFASIGGVPWAVAAGATSVEHLLQTTPEDVALLAASDTVAVGLPLTSLYLREPVAPLRALVDAGARVALGTDCNPGSSMTTNLILTLQVAVLNARLTPQEALRAVTRGGAQAVGCPGGYDGRLRVGGPLCATYLDLDGPDRLFYELGAPARGARVRY
jgi:imidazolonepropionase